MLCTPARSGGVFLCPPVSACRSAGGHKNNTSQEVQSIESPKGADGSPRRGYYYGSCPSRLAEARAGHKNNTSQEVQSIESPERSRRKPPQGVLLWLLPLHLRFLSFYSTQLYRPPRLAEARAGHKNNTSQEVQSIESPKGADGSPRRGYYYGSCLWSKGYHNREMSYGISCTQIFSRRRA